MIVTHRGTLPEEHVYDGLCTFCASRVEATHNELSHTSTQRDGDNHYARCPVCERATIYFHLRRT